MNLVVVERSENGFVKTASKTGENHSGCGYVLFVRRYKKKCSKIFAVILNHCGLWFKSLIELLIFHNPFVYITCKKSRVECVGQRTRVNKIIQT